METRKFSGVYDDAEIVTRCCDCGYVLTDQELADFWDRRGVSKCVFCAPELGRLRFPDGTWKRSFPLRTLIKWLIFDFYGYQIHKAKIRIRCDVYHSNKVLKLESDLGALMDLHAEDIKPVMYSEIKNKYQIAHEEFTEKLKDAKDEARIIYYDALAHFGGASDQAPCTRNLNPRQKKSLLRILKKAVRT